MTEELNRRIGPRESKDLNPVLKDMVDRASGFAEYVFKRRHEIEPIWLAETLNGKVPLPSPLPFVNLDSKRLATAIVKNMFEIVGIRAYTFVVAAWAIEQPITDTGPRSLEDYNKLHPKGLETAPGRKEVVMIDAQHQDHGALGAFREIMRPEGKPPYLGPIEYHPFETMEGPMSSFLPQRGTRM